MARSNTSAEVIADVTEVGIMTDVSSGASSTLNGAHSAGTRTVTVAATGGTNFTNGDKIRIGDRPLLEAGVLESKSTDVFTMQSDTSAAYADGEAVVEVEDTPIGDLTETGIEIVHEGGSQPVQAGTVEGVYTYIPSQDQGILMNFSMLNMSLENWAEMAGQDPSTRISGVGTSIDPFVLDVREDMYGEQPERVWYFKGARIDGTIVRVEAFSGKIFAPEGSMSFTQGSASELPFAVRVLHGYRIQTWS